jgi:hypothetical protein
VGLTFAGSSQTLAHRVERLVQGGISPDVWERPLRRRALAIIAAVMAVAIGVCGPRGSASLVQSEAPAARGRVEVTIAAPQPSIKLAGELRMLEGELRQAEALLSRLPPDAVSAALVGDVRRRMHEVRQRLLHLDE